MINIKEKEALITNHLAVQKILSAIRVKQECQSCDHWSGSCVKFGAVPPEEVQSTGCSSWVEKDFIPF